MQVILWFNKWYKSNDFIPIFVSSVPSQRVTATSTPASVASTWSSTSSRGGRAGASASSAATTRTGDTVITARKVTTGTSLNPSHTGKSAKVPYNHSLIWFFFLLPNLFQVAFLISLQHSASGCQLLHFHYNLTIMIFHRPIMLHSTIIDYRVRLYHIYLLYHIINYMLRSGNPLFLESY